MKVHTHDQRYRSDRIAGLSARCTLSIVVAIIAVFNYYISVAQDAPFGRRFSEMAGLSLSVAALSFGVGYLLRGMGG